MTRDVPITSRCQSVIVNIQAQTPQPNALTRRLRLNLTSIHGKYVEMFELPIYVTKYKIERDLDLTYTV
jgi:hypothetical protein